jgi:hypothetical protein
MYAVRTHTLALISSCTQQLSCARYVLQSWKLQPFGNGVLGSLDIFSMVQVGITMRESALGRHFVIGVLYFFTTVRVEVGAEKVQTRDTTKTLLL